MMVQGSANLMGADMNVPAVLDGRTGDTLLPEATPEVLRSDKIKVVMVGKAGPNLFVTVMGPTMDSVSGGPARSLAYEERLKHGFENSGIENAGVMFSVDLNAVVEHGAKALDQIPRDRIKLLARKDMAFCAIYKLTRGI